MIPDPAVNIWAQTKNSLYPLYKERAEGRLPEMDCHAQAAEIYADYSLPEDRLLDAAGGSGYFFWSLKQRGLLGHYHLLDQTADFVDMGRRALAAELPPERFIVSSMQETPGRYEAVFCLNALFCLPDYRQGLERLLMAAGRLIILRSTFGERNEIRYETDPYLDPGAERLKSYFNIWRVAEVTAFMESYGFAVHTVVDRRTNDQPEISAGKLFPWRWLVGVKS
ncbi:MAG: class I SAM-dependent methyltransferase [Candidatus Adiutrix sp.]|jgi:hypothetical protein|nr:class I SAM-dependent methyltransferase [Candidatus Adiutrix sp.]